VDEPFLAALGKALRGRLHRAGLWDQPPAYLGYPEFQTWAEAFADGDAAAIPALDCYLEAIVQRYDSLADHLLKKDNIDGLIYLNIDRFILGRQKKHDPVGYSAFKNLQAALEEMELAGQVTTEGRDKGRLRNQSLIRFAHGAVPASGGQLEATVGRGASWEHAVPRQAKIGKGAQRLLRACLLTLPSLGVAAFMMGELVHLLKDLVRRAHAERNRPADSEIALEDRTDETDRKEIRIVQPDLRYVEAESFQVLRQRMHDAIGQLDLQERTRTGLHRLLEELSQHADAEEEIPSWAELARRLGVRRTTLWDHLQRLRELAERLRGTP
jgi:hypothetical protein